jgi:hypothetical protein
MLILNPEFGQQIKLLLDVSNGMLAESMDKMFAPPRRSGFAFSAGAKHRVVAYPAGVTL